MGANQGKGPISAVLRSTELGLFGSLLVILWVIRLLGPSQLLLHESTTQLSLLHQIGLYGVLAVGAAVVIISGGIDLSVGSVVALASVFCAKLLKEWLHDGATGPPSTGIVCVGDLA